MKRWNLFAAILALCLGLSGTVWAQDHDRDDRDRRDHRLTQGDRDRERNKRDRDDYYGNGRQGAYGSRGYGNLAYQTGYRDGIIDARHDYQSGRRFQPQRDGNYKHANRGYNSRLGDKNAYRQDYRSGYLEGYRSAYGRGQ